MKALDFCYGRDKILFAISAEFLSTKLRSTAKMFDPVPTSTFSSGWPRRVASFVGNDRAKLCKRSRKIGNSGSSESVGQSRFSVGLSLFTLCLFASLLLIVIA